MIFNMTDGGARKLSLSYTGTMTQSSITVDGAAYSLYALTTSGVLTVKGKGTADLWLCGGGAGGDYTTSYRRGFDGGAGAYCASLTAQKLRGEYAVVIGSGGSSGGAGGATTVTQGGAAILSVNAVSGKNGGTGGGAGLYTTDGDFNAVPTSGGTGDGVTKYPFADSANFDCHCAGGGGGAAYASNNTANGYHTRGGAGGTNGGNGSANAKAILSDDDATQSGGAGGAKGGGNGGKVIWHSTATSGGSATFYGSGGGGGGVRIPDGITYRGASGAGYQGVCYIRVAV